MHKLEQIKKELKEISQGKWEVNREADVCGYFRFSSSSVFTCDEFTNIKKAKINAKFIAAAPERIQVLVELVEASVEMAEFFSDSKKWDEFTVMEGKVAGVNIDEQCIAFECVDPEPYREAQEYLDLVKEKLK